MGDPLLPRSDPGTLLILLTNTYPFAPGEEFIESEIEHLSRTFDRVIVIPVYPNVSHGRRRVVPQNVSVIVPNSASDVRKTALEVVGYAARHPLRTLAAFGRALRSFPQPKHMVDDLTLDLFGCVLADDIAARVRAELAPGSRVLFYAYWMMGPARVAVQLRHLLGGERVPLISRAHGYDVFTERHASNFLPQRELLFAQIASVFTASRGGAEYLRDRYPAYADRISTRRLGVGPAISPGNASRESMTVYTCAYLVPVKRIPLLIEGLAAAQRRGLEVRWSHIGSGAEGYAGQVERLAERELVPGSYEFLGDLSNSEVRARYASHPGAVFMNVSESEGVPVSIMEALSQGFPVIATDVGGNGELIDDAGGMFPGLLDSTPTAEQIAERLEMLLTSDDETYAQYVQASLHHWERCWSSDENYAAFSAELRDRATRLD